MNPFSLFRRRARPRQGMGIPNTLTGYFETRSGNIVGWVREIHGSNANSVRVAIVGTAGTIISFDAAPDPERNRFVFSAPIEGRFTDIDIIKEKVLVLAADSEGNSGRLMLDGIAQLSLIREYLSAPSTTILDLDFTTGGNSRPYIGPGWLDDEEYYTWTESDDSFVNFPKPSEAGKYVLRAILAPYIRKPEVLEQELAIFIDTTLIGHVVCIEPREEFHEFKFRHDAFADNGTTSLRLHHPTAVCPPEIKDRGGTSRIAFRVKRLTLAHLLKDED